MIGKQIRGKLMSPDREQIAEAWQPQASPGKPPLDSTCVKIQWGGVIPPLVLMAKQLACGELSRVEATSQRKPPGLATINLAAAKSIVAQLYLDALYQLFISFY